MDLTGTKFRVPEERYLNEPTNESCYQYLKDCYAKISADHGEYTAFITPVLQFESATSMTRLFNDIDLINKLNSFFVISSSALNLLAPALVLFLILIILIIYLYTLITSRGHHLIINNFSICITYENCCKHINFGVFKL